MDPKSCNFIDKSLDYIDKHFSGTNTLDVYVASPSDKMS